MKTIRKIAMLSLLSMSTIFCTSQAKADERDGTIERFTCLDLGVPDGHLRSDYIRLTAKDIGKKLGFGGGDIAMRLTNDGLNSGTFYTGTGCAATFIPQKKENLFKITYKPVGVKPENVRVYICTKNSDGSNGYLLGTLAGFHPIATGNGWFTAGDDLDTFGTGFRGAIIQRISVVLNARGDNGRIFIGNIQVASRKDLLDPSTLIMDEVPCTSGLTCGALNQ
jgi:hypothetical protein